MNVFQIDSSDHTGVNIIAFRRMNQMDVSGNVVTADDYLSSLKVRCHIVNIIAFLENESNGRQWECGYSR